MAVHVAGQGCIPLRARVSCSRRAVCTSSAAQVPESWLMIIALLPRPTLRCGIVSIDTVGLTSMAYVCSDVSRLLTLAASTGCNGHGASSTPVGTAI